MYVDCLLGPTLRETYLFNSWYPVQWGDSQQVRCQHSRQTKKKAISSKEWPTGLKEGNTLAHGWVGKLDISFPYCGTFCRVRSRRIAGHAPPCAKTHIIRLVIWLNGTITAVGACCSPEAAGGLTPQGDPLASHTYSLALEEILVFFSVLPRQPFKNITGAFLALRFPRLSFKIAFSNHVHSELLHTKKCKICLFLHTNISVSTASQSLFISLLSGTRQSSSPLAFFHFTNRFISFHLTCHTCTDFIMKEFWVFDLWLNFQINAKWELIHCMIILHIKDYMDV